MSAAQLHSRSLIACYLVAVTSADLAVYVWGPRVLPATAFVMIGLELGTRNRLHEHWRHDRCWARMVGLIAAALGCRHFCVPGPRIAAASFVAFLVSGLAATWVYAHAAARRAVVKGSLSAFVGGLTDSLIFPTLAFGLLDPWTSLSQFAGKTLGGIVWSALLVAVDGRHADSCHIHEAGEPCTR